MYKVITISNSLHDMVVMPLAVKFDIQIKLRPKGCLKLSGGFRAAIILRLHAGVHGIKIKIAESKE